MEQSNRLFLLRRLYDIAPLKVRSRPPYVYIDPCDLDSVETQLAELEIPLRVILPPQERSVLYDGRRKHKGRMMARLILRANNITPIVERFNNGEITTTRWNLGPLNAEEHARHLWKLGQANSTSE